MKKIKTYKITFTTDYVQYKQWADKGTEQSEFWKRELKENPKQLAICQKYSGKTVKLSDIPAFIEEVGECVISKDKIEVYNDYRE